MTAQAVRGWYPALIQPPGTPPTVVFGPVWSVLYILIGTAGWLVWKRRGASRPLRLWGWQLAANALWAPAFFGLHSPRFAMGVLLVLVALIALTIRAFLPVRRLAGWMMLPYLTGACSRPTLTSGSGYLIRLD